jgi:hypothetical protein
MIKELRSKRMHKRGILFSTALAAVILVCGTPSAYGQTSELKTLSGRIRWNKAMGLLPKTPTSREAAENICAQFFVVVIAPGSEKPYQYDIALEAKPEPTKPDYYSCYFEMQVPNNVGLTVHPGMGNGLTWPNHEKFRHYYTLPWVDAGQFVRRSGERSFTPAQRSLTLGNKGMYTTFELVDEGRDPGQAPAKDSFVVASRAVFSPAFAPVGSAVLTWDAGPGHPNAELWVSYNGSRERTVVAKQPKGAQQAQVQRGFVYTYILMDGRNVLATTTVAGQ